MTSSRAIPRRAHSRASDRPLSAAAELISRLSDSPEATRAPQSGQSSRSEARTASGTKEAVDLLHPPTGQGLLQRVHQGDHPLGGALKFRRQEDAAPISSSTARSDQASPIRVGQKRRACLAQHPKETPPDRLFQAVPVQPSTLCHSPVPAPLQRRRSPHIPAPPRSPAQSTRAVRWPGRYARPGPTRRAGPSGCGAKWSHGPAPEGCRPYRWQ